MKEISPKLNLNPYSGSAEKGLVIKIYDYRISRIAFLGGSLCRHDDVDVILMTSSCVPDDIPASSFQAAAQRSSWEGP